MGAMATADLGCLAQTVQRRNYKAYKVIPWDRVRRRVLESENKWLNFKHKNHSETLKRFRLTRFGWERRRAGLNSTRRRNWSHAHKKKTRAIDYVHRTDLPKLVKTAPFW